MFLLNINHCLTPFGALISCILVLLTTDIASSLNIEELKSINYEVNILQKPLPKDEDLSSFVPMTTCYGQQYNCVLPQIGDVDSSDKDNSEEKNLDIKDLLKPMKANSCLIKVKDWWTYEFCYGHYIKQFHIEDGKIIGQVNTLGLYDSDFDWDNETNQVIQKYHSQFYVNGSSCDLTGQRRSAEVRLYCEEDSGDYIYRVDEPGTCSYIITIHTSRLCEHPYLKPISSKKTNSISCYPVLTDEQYSKYMQKTNKAKELVEQERTEWLNNQQERLQVMKNENFNQIESDDISRERYSDASLDRTSLGKTQLLKQLEEILAREVDKNEPFSDVEDKSQQDSESPFKAEGSEVDNLENNDIVIQNEEIDESNENVQNLKDIKPGNIAGIDKEDTFTSNEEGNHNLEITQEGDPGENTPSSKEENQPNSVKNNDELHVRIMRLDRKIDSNGKVYEMDSTQRKQLEEAVKDKLEKALDTGGRRIEVKIITAGYPDNANEEGKDFHSLSDEETSQFQNMIMALFTDQQEAVKETIRHKKLEESYKFTWDEED